MNVRFVICLVAALGLTSIGARGEGTGALADVTPVPADVGITDAAKHAVNQATYTAEITQKVTAEVQKMSDNASDAGTVNMVRTWLINENPTSATPSYQQAYAAALNTAFINQLGQPNTPVNFRINVGIVIKNLSGNNENLAPTVIKLLGDNCAAVVLWGERAAASIFPLAMQNANGQFNAQGGTGSKMLDAIVASLSAHLDGWLSGDIAESAFRAVNPSLWERKMTPAPAAMSALVDANLKMQQARITAYENSGVPDNPRADTYPSYMIFQASLWSTLTPQQQLTAVQNAVNLTSYMGQRAAMRASNQNQDLVGALQEEGRWIQALGSILGDQNVQQAGSQIRGLQQAMTPKTITDACDNAFTQLQGIQAFQTLTPPKSLSNSTAKTGSDASTGSTPTSLAPQ